MAAAEPEPTPPKGEAVMHTGVKPDLRWLIILTALALATRLVWVLVVHPPEDYVFSDMKKYVERAQGLAAHGLRTGVRPLAWQAWGTHTLMALPLWLFGKDSLRVVSVLYGLLGAAAVPLAYLLACRVCTRKWMGQVVGVGALLWHPNLSTTGYFLSEPPFLCLQLWSTYWLVVAFQDGKRALGAGLVSAVAFALRPQSALFFLLTFATWWLNRRRLPRVRLRHLAMVSVPLLLMLMFSFWRFHSHTGYWSGVAENANMNFTAGRCHNIVTQAFKSQAALDRSDRRGSTRDGRRVSLPGFRVLRSRFPPNHPLALRPAFDHESIKFVGYVGDPDVHAAIRRACYAKTGFFEQVRYSAVNLSLQWFFARQWPEMERGRKRFYRYIHAFQYIYQIVILVPSLIGVVLGLRAIRRNPGLALCAWQLITSMVIAAIFFGTLRLRTPYDPYAILLAVEGWAVVVIGAVLLYRRKRQRGT